MEETSHTKKLEVAQHYLLGDIYRQIEEETGVSHGSIANIIRGIENSKLTIPGTPLDQVNDLRQLSVDLKKKGLEPSQAQLGLSPFERLQALKITPELLDKWSELAKKLTPADFPASDFLEAALRLHELEKGEGKPFVTLAEEYARLREGVDKLQSEVDSLSQNKTKLIREAQSLRPQLESLERDKKKLETEVEIQTRRLQELKSKTKEVEEEKLRLDGKTKDLQSRKIALSSEIDGKEASLRRLNEIGLSDEDLLRLVAFIERSSQKEGISGGQLKEKFFSALNLFEDVSGLEEQRKAEMQQVNELVKKQSIVSGEIIELEKKRGILEGKSCRRGGCYTITATDY